ncbi:MAG TPA: GNAT family protein [Candidatus Limnocylindria bacterium]|nr:GNAT family protein [Candidatus Limnocylindria bacterium]
MLRPDFPLRTERLLLRPFDDGDLDQLLVMQADPDVARYLYWEPRDREEVAQSIQRFKPMDRIDDESDSLRLAAVLRDSGELVGDYSLRLYSREHLQGEIGFITHPAHQGHGFATEGSALLLRLGFEELALHRIFGSCDGRNRASAGVMERLGMRREAHFRENEFVKGTWTDELIYAMLASEWEDRAPR